jgi:cation:H+ antiporter
MGSIGIDIALNLGLIIGCSFVLVKSVDLFISSSTKLAQNMKLSGYTISFLLIAIATSFPELTVAVTSASAGKPILSYGDALGSNIALLTLMTAIPGLMGNGMNTREIFKNKDVYFALLFALLVLALSFDRTLSRIDGIVLITGYVFYFIAFVKRSSSIEKLFNRFHDVNMRKQLLLFAISLIILVVAGRGIVVGATNLADLLNIKLVLIGLTLTALGTNMPEMAYIIKQQSNNAEDEVLGDIVGSVVANTTVVLGVAATIHPIYLNGTLIGISSFAFLLLSLLLFFVFSKTKGRIDKWESVALLFTYVAFVLTELAAKSH